MLCYSVTFLASAVSSASHIGPQLEFTQTEPWKQFCHKLLYIALVLGGPNFVDELQSMITELISNMHSFDLFTWLVAVIPGAALTSLDDYHWLASVDMIAGKSGFDQRHLLIITDPDDSSPLLIKSLPVLLRFLVWKRAADIMPGQSNLWEQELAREVGNRSANHDSVEETFLKLADAQQIFEFDFGYNPSSAWTCPIGFDLPRSNGGDRIYVGRRIALHSQTGNVMFHSVTCQSPFARAWCRFLLRSCYMFVKREWSIGSLHDSLVPKGRLCFSEAHCGYTLHHIYIMLQLVPDNCLMLAAAKPPMAVTDDCACKCHRCSCFNRVRDELHMKSSKGKTSDNCGQRNLCRSHSMSFKSVWEELLSVIQRVERGDDFWAFWQPDRSHREVVLSASSSSRDDVERDLPSTYLEWSDIKSHWFYRGFVSKETEQESARLDIQDQVNRSRLGQAMVDQLRAREEQRRSETSKRVEQEARQETHKLTRGGHKFKADSGMEFVEGLLTTFECKVTFKVHALHFDGAPPVLRLQENKDWDKIFSVPKVNTSMPQSVQHALARLYSQVVSHHTSLSKQKEKQLRQQTQRSRGPQLQVI